MKHLTNNFVSNSATWNHSSRYNKKFINSTINTQQNETFSCLNYSLLEGHLFLWDSILYKRIALPLLSKMSLSALTNIPCFGLQEKYFTPCTEPSFFPLGASSSTPIQVPPANSVPPM